MTTHVWDGSNIIMELDSENAITDRYIRGIGLIKSDDFGFYLFNAHGDVVQLADNGGGVVKSYQYDAFGVEIGKDDNDTNPFRYCGEYWDEETGTIYLRARYYEPRTGRFSAEDPIRSGLNWYIYAGNNPITFIDPSGCVIKLTDKNSLAIDIILENLRMITSDTISIDKNGYLVVEYVENPDLKLGTELVRRIYESDFTCSISISLIKGSAEGHSYGDDNNAIDGTGTDTYVRFNPNTTILPIMDMSTKTVSNQEDVTWIGLAHELIHAEREMRGGAYSLDDMGSYSYLIRENLGNGMPLVTTKVDSRAKKEELATVGLRYYRPGDITENAIRAEHGLNLRGAY